MAIIARLGVVLGLNTTEFVTGMAKADKVIADFRKSINKMGPVVLGASAAFVAATVSALHYADSIADVAVANNVSIDTIVKLQNALAMNGGEAENASKIMSGFTKSVESAADGSIKAQQAFADARVSIDDLRNLSDEDLFKKTIEGLDKIPDALTRNGIAMQLFGRAIKGVDVKNLNTSMKDGAELAEQQAKAIQDAGDTYDILGQKARDFNQMVAEKLGPTIKSFVTYLDKDGKEAMEWLANWMLGSAQAMAIFVTSAVTGGKILIDVFKDISFMTISLFSGHPSGIKDFLEEQNVSIAKAAQDQADFMDNIMKLGEKPPPGKLQGDKKPLIPAEKEKKDITDALGNEIKKNQAAFDLSVEQYHIEEKRMDLLGRRGELTTAEYNAALEDLDLQKQLADIEKKYNLDLLAENNKRGNLTKSINAEADAARLLAVKESQARLQAISDANKYELDQQAQLSNIAIARSSKLFDLERAGRLLRVEDLQLQKDIFQIQSDLGDEIRRIDKLQLDDADAQIAKAKELADAKINEANRQHAITTRGGTPGEGFTDAMTKAINDLPTAMQNGAAMFESMMGNMSKSLTDFVMTGKASFKDFAKSIIADIMAIYIRSQILTMLKGIFPSIGGPSVAPEGPSNFLGMFGGKATGGYIDSPTVVGENGPELFIPKTAGTVVPNQQMSGMGGGSPQVVYNGPYIANMSAIDTQSATQFLAKNNKSVWAANAYANKSLAVTGGRT